MEKTVLIMGASGLFGSSAAKAFDVAGWNVRPYKRDTDAAKAAKGVQVVVNAMNPPGYHDWKTLFPQITAQGIAAAKSAGATLIVPGNVYVYGLEASPWGPQTPQRPASKKGAIRVASEATLRAAAAAGVQTIILRGGDFIAPDLPGSILNMITLKGLAKGRIEVLAPMDVRRAWAYLPDMARAAVALAENRDSLPAFTDMTFAGITMTMAQMKARLEAMLGHDLKVRRFPWWAMKLASPFWELARELCEMRYLYNHSHALDAAPLAAALPDFRMTPLDTVLREHIKRLVPHGASQGTSMLTQTGR